MEKLLSYFSFAGRTKRQRYWLTSLAMYGVLLVTGLIAVLVPLIGGILALIVFIAILWAMLALSTRRLHDRNKSGWWLVAMYLPVGLVSAFAAAVSVAEPDAGSAIGLLSLPFTIWAFIELGCMKGTSGSNRFGPDPLLPVSDAFA